MVATGIGLLDMIDSHGLRMIAHLDSVCGLNKRFLCTASVLVMTGVGLACLILCVVRISVQ